MGLRQFCTAAVRHTAQMKGENSAECIKSGCSQKVYNFGREILPECLTLYRKYGILYKVQLRLDTICVEVKGCRRSAGEFSRSMSDFKPGDKDS